jgi:ABC-type transport system involved in multi-copper enzyme maturation permease subunit
MAEVLDRPRAPELLHYRAWRGELRRSDLLPTLGFVAVQCLLFFGAVTLEATPAVRLVLAALFIGLWAFVVRLRAWPIARVSMLMLFRRKLFWALYALALMVFMVFFFGQYLMSWATTQLGEADVRLAGVARANPRFLVQLFSDALKMNGSPETFRNFIAAEVNTVMIVLVLAGSVLVGNDLRFRSLPFFLSKPISRWDYLLGKGLAVAAFLNLFTTVPAVVLWVQYGMLESWDYFFDEARLLVGILGFGLVLTASCTLILLTMATWLQRTVPLIMTWTALFAFCRILSTAMVQGMGFDPRWRLIDVWNSASLIGSNMLHVAKDRIYPQPQPSVAEAALVLTGVCVLCLTYLILRVRAVEVVR